MAERADAEEACEGAKHHSPTPIVLHTITLASGRQAQVCGTCRDNVAVLRDMIEVSPEPVPWPVRRTFGNLARALAEES